MLSNLLRTQVGYASSPLASGSWKPRLLVAGSEEGAVEAKRALLGAVGKVTDVVSSLGFSWWQGGPPHTQALKDLHWVRAPAGLCTRPLLSALTCSCVSR